MKPFGPGIFAPKILKKMKDLASFCKGRHTLLDNPEGHSTPLEEWPRPIKWLWRSLSLVKEKAENFYHSHLTPKLEYLYIGMFLSVFWF